MSRPSLALLPCAAASPLIGANMPILMGPATLATPVAAAAARVGAAWAAAVATGFAAAAAVGAAAAAVPLTFAPAVAAAGGAVGAAGAAGAHAPSAALRRMPTARLVPLNALRMLMCCLPPYRATAVRSISTTGPANMMPVDGMMLMSGAPVWSGQDLHQARAE